MRKSGEICAQIDWPVSDVSCTLARFERQVSNEAENDQTEAREQSRQAPRIKQRRLSRCCIHIQRRGADSLWTDWVGGGGISEAEDDFSNSSRTIVTSGGAVIPILTRSPSTARTETLMTPSRIILSPTFRRKTNMSGLFLWKRLRLKHPCAATLTHNRLIIVAVQTGSKQRSPSYTDELAERKG